MSKLTHYQKTAADLRMQLDEALIDHEAFETLLKPCTLERCSATCCYDGVYLSDEEARGVKCLVENERERFVDYGLKLPKNTVVTVRNGKAQKTATRSAEPGELAKDFPSHFEKTRCVFLDDLGRCGIQRMCIDDDLGSPHMIEHKATNKPTKPSPNHVNRLFLTIYVKKQGYSRCLSSFQ